MKKYLNPANEELRNHLDARKGKRKVYAEEGRPRNATRVWLSYDITDDAAPRRKALEDWLVTKQAESFGNSVATYVIEGKCYSQNAKVAEMLMRELRNANVLDADDLITSGKPYLKSQGLSIYVIYRSRNNGDGALEKLYSGQFVLIQTAPISHLGGY